MNTTTKTETDAETTNLVDDAEKAAEHAEASSLAVIRPEQQRFDENQRAILRQLGIEEATDGDLDLFFHYCRTTGLDPFRRQIYMIGRNTKVVEWVENADGSGRRKLEKFVTKYTIQTGIDGYRRNVREAAKTLGDEIRFGGPWFTAADDFHIAEDGEVIQHWRKVWPHKSAPWAAKFVVYRNGEEFEGIAHYDEFVQTGYNGEPNSMWSKMPRNQLAKCAEALAYRRAYPDDLSGLILEDAAQPTVIDQEGHVVSGGRPGRPSAPSRPAPVTVDEIFAEEVPLSSENPGAVTDNPLTREEIVRQRAEQLAPETPAGDTEDQGAEQPAPADPSPAAPAATSKPEPKPDTAQAAAPAKAAPAKKAAAKKAAPREVSKLRVPLEKRVFTLLGDAGIAADKDRDGRIAVYRAITDRPDVESTNDLTDVELGNVGDQLYVWQQQNELDDQIAGILSDAAREAEETAKASAEAPTSEGIDQ